MAVQEYMVNLSVNRPRALTAVMVLVTVLFAAIAALPSLWSDSVSFLHPVTVDTDPENMLSHDEAVRIFHDRMKKEMSLHDMVVLGIVNEVDPDGVFNPESLRKIHELTEFAKTLRWPDENDPDKEAGVIEVDLIAPSTVDNIEPVGLGVVKFEWLMAAPPQTREESLEIRRKAERIPFLNGTVLSEDGKALCVYLPITSKDVSYQIYTRLKERIAGFDGDEQYFITGLPVAEDTFGVEMFKQMAISAPSAMAIIFLIMLFFFRKFVLVLSPMIVAMVSVILTMGLLVATGNTIHIMSSMIPIFIMPIAVLDAVHILSEFFDRYQETRDRKATLRAVMDTLFAPMLYTSLTTAVGFASLALTPIPPVQVFGLFVAFGVLCAWFWTVLFVPAFIMFISDKSLENFGHPPGDHHEEPKTILTAFLAWTGRLTFRRARTVVAITVLVAAAAVYGIFQNRINDNPPNRFHESHPIRVADKVLNEHFGGTYMAYLALESKPDVQEADAYAEALSKRIDERGAALAVDDVDGAKDVFEIFRAEALLLGRTASTKEELLEELEAFAEAKSASEEDLSFTWDEALLFVDEERGRGEVFKQPAILNYVAGLQEHLLETGVVGKANSLADIVKTVHRELLEGSDEAFRIPDSANAVAQCLFQFQSGHRPGDLWHFVTPDYTKTVIWAQLRSGDNSEMAAVAESLDRYIARNPPPSPLDHQWFGLTYINVVWQDKMVSGMLQAFLGSFLIVFLMMTIVYRSALWGFLSMIPLTVTIALIYGMIGFVGKDYDMPAAVLSSLSIGLAVDYAIHFLTRSRSLRNEHGSWAKAAGWVFGEPARAIARNVVVVGVGFLPLLLAPLVPYQTVGVFIAAILFTAGLASLLILPALIAILERWLFPEGAKMGLACKCGTVVFSGAALTALIAINVRQFVDVEWTTLTWPSLGIIVILAAACYFTRRMRKCTPGIGPVEGEIK